MSNALIVFTYKMLKFGMFSAHPWSKKYSRFKYQAYVTLAALKCNQAMQDSYKTKVIGGSSGY